MDGKIKLKIPVIVEGKYDRITLSNVIDGNIITTNGFGVFNSAEKRALIRRLSERGAIVLCDSDGGGKVIRGHISSLVPKDRLFQLYVPQIRGKERRKDKASAEGYLGVEGMSADVLREIFEKFLALHPEAVGDAAREGEKITKTDMYAAGLSGGENASLYRDRLAASVSLPAGMTANALLAALNMIMTREEFFALTRDG